MGNQSAEDNAKDKSDESRRNLLKVGLGVGAALVVGGAGSITRLLINPGVPETVATTQTTTENTTAQTGSENSTSATQSASQSAFVPPPAVPNFPVILIANLSDLEVGVPISFNYPLEETPNILVKLGVQAKGGVGPDSDIVAFSQVCQHLGCIYGFVESWLVTKLRQYLQSHRASWILLLPRQHIRPCKCGESDRRTSAKTTATGNPVF